MTTLMLNGVTDKTQISNCKIHSLIRIYVINKHSIIYESIWLFDTGSVVCAFEAVKSSVKLSMVHFLDDQNPFLSFETVS